MKRRSFIERTGLATAALGMGLQTGLANSSKKTNTLPKWKGFNLLDFFVASPNNSRQSTQEQHLKWMAEWGFDFVRLPMAYPYFLKFDRSKPIELKDIRRFNRKAVREVDQILEWADKYGLHISLNLHRAPGFCVNAGFEEPYNLWYDAQAMDDFCHHWRFWARRYRKLSNAQISFDLLNEPCLREDMNDQHSNRNRVPGDKYRNLVLRAMNVIREEKPDALIVADGNNVGSEVIEEITDLPVAQSCRGYAPQIISHYRASWVYKDMEALPEPTWPITFQDNYYDKSFLQEFYAPWVDLVKKGVGVHCGECGCYTYTPHKVFLSWFTDILDIFRPHNIGFALWEFRGAFGILDSKRKDVTYKNFNGHQLDEKLLTLLAEH